MDSVNRPDPAQYQSTVKRPADFDEFWEGLLSEAAAIPLAATVELDPLRSTSDVEVYDVRYDSLDGVRIAGWYCLPRERSGRVPAIAEMPGYVSEPARPGEQTGEGHL